MSEIPGTAAGESPAEERRTGPWILLGALLAFAGTVIFLLYNFVLGPGLMSNVVRQRQATAQTQILALHTALEGWSARQQGRYPESLAAVVEPDARGGTLLGGARELPLDPWGHAYVYARPTPGQLRPSLTSLGRDGLPGGTGEDADVDREGVVRAR